MNIKEEFVKTLPLYTTDPTHPLSTQYGLDKYYFDEDKGNIYNPVTLQKMELGGKEDTDPEATESEEEIDVEPMMVDNPEEVGLTEVYHDPKTGKVYDPTTHKELKGEFVEETDTESEEEPEPEPPKKHKFNVVKTLEDFRRERELQKLKDAGYGADPDVIDLDEYDLPTDLDEDPYFREPGVKWLPGSLAWEAGIGTIGFDPLTKKMYNIDTEEELNIDFNARQLIMDYIRHF